MVSGAFGAVEALIGGLVDVGISTIAVANSIDYFSPSISAFARTRADIIQVIDSSALVAGIANSIGIRVAILTSKRAWHAVEVFVKVVVEATISAGSFESVDELSSVEVCWALADSLVDVCSANIVDIEEVPCLTFSADDVCDGSSNLPALAAMGSTSGTSQLRWGVVCRCKDE